jgi:peptidyl-dipeptidase Dcp
MRRLLPLFVAVLACPVPGGAQPAASNPFFQEWKAPFGVPPFAQIKDDHFLPAYQHFIAEQRREVEDIAGRNDEPTFANTVAALDASGEGLDRVEGVFGNLTSAETNERLQAIQRQVTPLISALQDDTYLNPRLFARVKKVWEGRATLKGEELRLVEELYKRFLRGGANLDAAQKERVRQINGELSLLGVRFGNNLLKETNAFKLVIEDNKDLAGLSEGLIAAAYDAGKAAGLPGKAVFTLQAPSIWPFLSYAENRELRRRILTAYFERCGGGAADNRQNLTRLAALRAEKARLLGYKTFADFVLEERMAKTPARVYSLLNQLWEPARKVAQAEAKSIQGVIDEEKGGFKLAAWDWRYYAEKIKRARYELDENQLREYFTLDNVRQGAFYVANRLYGITVTERTDLPKYHPEVRTFEVKDADGSHLGIFMADYHPRPGKRGGAWSSRFRSQYVKDGKDVRPLVANVCNFTRPSAGQPALLRLEEVETLFHEFGHALHALLSRVHYRTLGVVPRDFVELPSQIMENWATEPEVLKVYAKHYKTGAAIPAELLERIEKAARFNQGFATVEYLAASFLDMDWHTVTADTALDAAAFESASMARIGMPAEIAPRYHSAYFQHIFASSGYSAGYYSYIWSEVLDSDAFQAFKEKGLFHPATARAFRTRILEKGGTEDATEMYRKFRGREASVEPLLEKRGLK